MVVTCQPQNVAAAIVCFVLAAFDVQVDSISHRAKKNKVLYCLVSFGDELNNRTGRRRKRERDGMRVHILRGGLDYKT